MKGYNWRKYNEAQQNEKEVLMKLLKDLCNGLRPRKEKTGRPRIPSNDMVFCCVLKVYSMFSGRRFTSDMKFANEQGFIKKVPHYNSLFNYFQNPDFMRILMTMIKKSSLALKSVEKDFAIDSSGFSTHKYNRWTDFKYRYRRNEKVWIKTHLVCGVKTNIVTAVKLTDSNFSDTLCFEDLICSTAENFDIEEVSADKAYLSRSNLTLVDGLGAVPYIPFKINNRSLPRGCVTWKKMFHYFKFKNKEFMKHYHKRSNVESTFHMIKTKFGDSVKSKNRTAQFNEVLCKILCHNICIVAREIDSLNLLEIAF